MAIRKIKDSVYAVGTIDWDRELFDSLIPLPDGTTYNSYLVVGSEKTALIDTNEPEKRDEYFNNIWQLNPSKIDYIVANHAEQDHSGLIPDVLELYPDAKVVTNQKCKNFLIDLLDLSEDSFIVVENGETLSLGNKTLEFIFTPWTHWPETMVTYLKEDNILFSCDLFGSHHASSNLYCYENTKTYNDAKRYFAEIMMPFRNHIKKHISVLEQLKIDIIAPSHGPLYKKPEFIMNAYKDWVSDDTKNLVVIPYVSMHGSTSMMVNYLVDNLINAGIEVKPFNMATADLGELAITLVDATTLVVAAPMVLSSAHPMVVNATYLANILRPKTKYLAIMGSYSWGGRLVDTLTPLLSNFKAEVLEPTLIKGMPKAESYKEIDKLSNEIILRHKTLFTNDTTKQSLTI